MKAALLACPATREWATEKLAEGERQFERIWQEAREQADDQRPSEPKRLAGAGRLLLRPQLRAAAS